MQTTTNHYNGTDTTIGTSTSTKDHIIPLNHQLNITNTMMSLMIPSASCYCHVHEEIIYPSNATYKPHMPISSCPHMTPLCQYIFLL